jgi:peptide/nickel transport system substrate-binding protein
LIADGPIFPGTWAYYDDIQRIDYDSTEALQAIKAAGYSIPAEGSSVREKEGIRFAFEMVYPNTPEHANIAEAIQKDWAKLGVDVTLKPVPYDELVTSYLEPRAYQAALVDLNLARYPDPDPYPFWDQAQITGGQNYAQWNDRQASEFLEQARILPDLAERAKAYRNFQVRFVNEMPALPLFFPVYSYGVDQSIQGVRMGPLFDTSDRFATIRDWFLIAKRSTAASITPSLTP